ncbi:hypothetical protein ACFQE5_03915 [Pseudonocardia hispaniensis]|uniref:Uncharacterized protein n=1 Tax=Pseudonocardia hispaniensis TaxID=904933 RepID=A0ABW1IXZ9_9PSEU
MLLLVLILVMIAFGLLVVALLSGSVLWAWVSVAVSVGAAGVLLVDWMQRRAAVKAGAEIGRPIPPPLPAVPPVDSEPATEIIPIVPAVGSAPGVPDGAGVGGVGGGDGPEIEPSASDATTVLPVVQPSGSADGPSGAGESSTPSGVFSSPSVTESAVDDQRPGVDRIAEPDPAGGPVDAQDGDPAGAADEPRGPAPAAAESSGEAADGRAEHGAPASAAVNGVPQAELSADEIDGPTLAVASAGTAGSVGQQPSDPSDSGQAESAAGAAPTDGAGAATVFTPAGAREPSAAQPERWRGAQAGPPPLDLPRGAAVDVRGGSLPPLGPGGEPPEEPRNADAAALMAELEDEVVVVDELPRYHLAGCRSLPGMPIIPLPVREAVELGFTPCGWCTPDRVLSGRHPARVR